MLKRGGVLKILIRFPSSFGVIVSEPMNLEEKVFLPFGGAGVFRYTVNDVFCLVSRGYLQRCQSFGVGVVEVWPETVSMELMDFVGDKVLTNVGVGDLIAVFELVFDEERAAVAGKKLVRLSVRICDDNV